MSDAVTNGVWKNWAMATLLTICMGLSASLYATMTDGQTDLQRARQADLSTDVQQSLDIAILKVKTETTDALIQEIRLDLKEIRDALRIR